MQHGASEVRTRYEKSVAVGIAFVTQTPFGEQTFALPVHPDKVLRRLTREYDEGRLKGIRRPDLAHARIVAWRNLKAWLLVLFDQIETGTLDFGEAMLGYVEVEPGKSMYQVAVEKHALLPGPKEGR